ncbi:MAG: hypothetical protein QOF84_1335, partial [Streptomyces sp.]|nr:hypothetical protein [Streptomyces sp.]
ILQRHFGEWVPVLAGQPFLTGGERRAEPLDPDPRPDQAADLLVGDDRVQDDRQDLIQQRLPG